MKNLNFEITRNDCIAIIGPSGSGKTTLVDIFLGLLKPTSGEILINNKESQNKNVLFNLSAYLPQDSLVIEDTIKRNIALEVDENKIDFDLIDRSIKESNLDKFIYNLPNKIETVIGENGLRLSGGQKQD